MIHERQEKGLNNTIAILLLLLITLFAMGSLDPDGGRVKSFFLISRLASASESGVNVVPAFSNRPADASGKLSKLLPKSRKGDAGKNKSIGLSNNNYAVYARIFPSFRTGEWVFGVFQSLLPVPTATSKASSLPAVNLEYFPTALALLPNPRSPPFLHA
jgi:hypothetical protein